MTDASGATVGAASVEAINNATHITYKADTNKSGTYYIPYVVPGEYTVKVAAEGFKTEIQDNVLIQAGTSHGLNLAMSVGAASTSVTVTDAPPLLDTVSGSGGTILDQREIQNLPMNGRQVYSLIGTTPGSQVLPTGSSTTTSWDTSNGYVIGGGVQAYQQFTLNGTNITRQATGQHGTWEISPNIDAIQEVNVMTSTYDARFGRTGGGTVNLVVKSGSNQFHGDVFEYFENGALNANNYENNLNGIRLPDVHQNQFGGVFGGPIKKDKLFFFGSFEGFRNVLPGTTVTSVPPAYLRPQADGSINFTPSGYTIYDPNTTYCTVPGGSIGNCSGPYARKPFPNDTIPASRLNAVGLAVLKLYPLPNTTVGGLQNNYVANTPQTLAYSQPMVRVDYDLNSATRLYTLFAYQHGTLFQNYSGFSGAAQNGNINEIQQTLTATQDVTHMFSPTMVGDFKLSFSRYQYYEPDYNVASTVDPSSIGLNMPQVPTTNIKQLPEFTTTDGFYPQVAGNQVNVGVSNNIVFDGDVTKTWGNHTVHLGGEFGEYQFADPGQVNSANGAFSFGSQYTQYNPLQRGTISGINDGFDIADMVLGYPDSGHVDYADTYFTTYPAWAVYFQDDWRATNRLTLNVGLRYDVQVGSRERHNGINRGMCLTCVNPTTSNPAFQNNLAAASGALTAAGINPSSLATVYGGIQFAGAGGQPKDAYDTDFSNIGPRIGFAYQLNDKTVLRGGWGLMYSMGLENGTYSGFAQSTNYTPSLNGNLTPGNNFASGNPFPNGVQAPLGSAGGLLTDIGNPKSLDFPQRKIPRVQITSFGFQRALPAQMTLDARYSGNFSTRLRTSIYHNATLSLAQLQQGIANPNLFNQQVPNPYYGVLPSNSAIGSTPTISALTLMLPYSAFGPVLQYDAPLGKNGYNALEVKLNKRVGSSDGLSFQLAYTYSKTMTANNYLNSYPYQDPSLQRQIGSTDRTHVFSLATEYNLPIGKGAKFLSNPGRVGGVIVNNWSMNGVLSAQTGFPVALNTNYYYNCAHSFTPDGGASLSHYLYNDYSNGNPLGCWSSIPQYALKNLPGQISSLRQPTIPNLDLSLQKNISLTELLRMQFRVDAFNVTNSVLFPGPDTNPADGPPVRQANGSYTGFGTVSLTQQNSPRVFQLALKILF